MIIFQIVDRSACFLIPWAFYR